MELLKVEMTPKERAFAYVKGERVDRIPCKLNASETASQLYGIDVCDYYHSSEAMVAVEEGLVRDTGADSMGMNIGLRGIAEAIGTEMAYFKDNVSSVKTPALKGAEDVRGRDLVDIHKDGRLPIMLEAFKVLKDRHSETHNIGTGTAGPLTLAGNILGTKKLLKALIKDPDGAKEVLQYSTDVIIKVAKDLWDELGVSISLAEPLASKNLMRKATFEEFCLPYLKQCVDEISSWQGGVSIHICGETNDRWDDIVNLGISSFWLDNCESLVDFKANFGDKVAIVGNTPPVDVLLYGTPSSIAESVKQTLLDAADNPAGFCLCPGCATPVGTSLENMVAYMNAATTFGKGAVKGKLPEGLYR